MPVLDVHKFGGRVELALPTGCPLLLWIKCMVKLHLIQCHSGNFSTELWRPQELTEDVARLLTLKLVGIHSAELATTFFKFNL